MPASAADEFASTERMATPSFHGLGLIEMTANRRKTRSRMTRQLLKMSRSMFSLQIQAQEARILNPSIDDIEQQANQQDNHYLPNHFAVGKDKTSNHGNDQSKYHCISSPHRSKNAFKNRSFSSSEHARC